MPRTILFMSHSADLYGAERSLLDLVARLDRSVFRPIVALPDEGPLREKLHDLGIETWITGHQKWIGGRHVWFAMWYRLARNALAFFNMQSWLKKENVDLIYTNTSAIPMGGLLARTTGLPHLWHIREYVPRGTSSRFYYGQTLSYRFIESTSDRIVCNSENLRDAIHKHIPNASIDVVYNGLLPDLAPNMPTRKGPSRSRTVRLCMVGGLGPNKGHEDAIRALHVLTSTGLAVHLEIAGEGQHKRSLMDLAQELNVGAHITWLGFVHDTPAVYQRADLTLVCSRWEAFGRIAVEAGARGCPVIASNQGGLTEVVLDEKTGLLYSPGDFEELARQIVRLVDDEALYVRLSQHAFQSVFERFTVTRYVQEIEFMCSAMTNRACS